jgi:hypothetical protein
MLYVAVCIYSKVDEMAFIQHLNMIKTSEFSSLFTVADEYNRVLRSRRLRTVCFVTHLSREIHMLRVYQCIRLVSVTVAVIFI